MKRSIGVALVIGLAAVVTSVATPAGADGSHAQVLVISIPIAPGNQPFLAVGPIHGGGIDTPRSGTCSGTATCGVDVFSLTRGSQKGSTFTVDHAGKSTSHFDRPSCTYRVREEGTWEITGGTRALAQANGRGHYTVAGDLRFALTGGVCVPPGPNTLPISGGAFVVATGQTSV